MLIACFFVVPLYRKRGLTLLHLSSSIPPSSFHLHLLQLEKIDLGFIEYGVGFFAFNFLCGFFFSFLFLVVVNSKESRKGLIVLYETLNQVQAFVSLN